MIVPDHWAEARKQHRSSGRQVTVRRYGWSTVSEADALAMAETRADEALRRILTGEKVNRREPKVAYNGASGVPIREEVLAGIGNPSAIRSHGNRSSEFLCRSVGGPNLRARVHQPALLSCPAYRKALADRHFRAHAAPSRSVAGACRSDGTAQSMDCRV